MAPIEPPTAPRKASWKRWIATVACVAAITLGVLFLKAPAPEPVTVTFVGFTNYNGERALVLKGTNGLPRKIIVEAGVLTTDSSTRPSYAGRRGLVGVAESFTFDLLAPSEGADWRIEWTFEDPYCPQTLGELTRAECCSFLSKHGMRTLARPFVNAPHKHFITAAEIKE